MMLTAKVLSRAASDLPLQVVGFLYNRFKNHSRLYMA